MGFPRDYTLAAVASSRYSSDKVNAEYERKALMGNSFSAQVVAWLLAHVLRQFELITRLPTPDELAAGIPLELASLPVEGEVEPEEFTGDEQERPPGFILARRIVGLAGHRGSDVRISQDSTAAPESWPRAEVPAHWWRWKTGFSFVFNHPEHINAFEVRAALATLRWRTRQRKFLNCKVVHLLDSSVGIGVLTRRRSTSWRLAPLVRRFCALELASQTHTVFGFTPSTHNHAD